VVVEEVVIVSMESAMEGDVGGGVGTSWWYLVVVERGGRVPGAGGGRVGVFRVSEAREQAASEHQLQAVVDAARSSGCHGRRRGRGEGGGGEAREVGREVDGRQRVCALCHHVVVSGSWPRVSAIVRQRAVSHISHGKRMQQRGMANSSTVVVIVSKSAGTS
jgi:hypothetical protein